jgi:hypothetical protein
MKHLRHLRSRYSPHIAPWPTLLAVFIVALCCLGAEAAVITVPCNTNALIDAITQANAAGGPNTLELESRCVYTLTTANNTGYGMDVDHNEVSGTENGLPRITSAMTINGNNATILRDPTAPAFRFFEIGNGVSFTLTSTILDGGRVSVNSAGGAIYTKGGIVSVRGCTFTHSYAGCGGAIDLLSPGVLTVTDSLFTDNTTDS